MDDVPIILIIDDDAAVLSSLGFLLEAEGYAVLACGDVGELLSVEIPRPGCVIIDFRMPVMNGLDVLRWLREKNIDAPAILVTGRLDANVQKLAFECGFARVLEKPVLGNTLAEVVRDLIGGL
ncbi:MAG: response regulator [Hyphomicrobiales bacterium]|nr:response regulator [Hyphomicrobiales bacterium]